MKPQDIKQIQLHQNPDFKIVLAAINKKEIIKNRLSIFIISALLLPLPALPIIFFAYYFISLALGIRLG